MNKPAHQHTERLDLLDSTLREWQATVLDVDDNGIVLDRSAFYPGGGGQPPDHGVLLWSGVQTAIVGARRGDDIRLIPADTGRSIEDLGIRLRMARSELLSLIRAVIIDLKTYQRDVWHQDGGCYSMTIKPFRRCDNRIEGAVLVFVDITAQQRSIW